MGYAPRTSRPRAKRDRRGRHRLSTVRLAHRIVVLERGRLVESGTHDELIRRGETYAQLFTELRGPPELAVA